MEETRIILKWIQKRAVDWAHFGLGEYTRTEAAVVPSASIEGGYFLD